MQTGCAAAASNVGKLHGCPCLLPCLQTEVDLGSIYRLQVVNRPVPNHMRLVCYRVMLRDAANTTVMNLTFSGATPDDFPEAYTLLDARNCTLPSCASALAPYSNSATVMVDRSTARVYSLSAGATNYAIASTECRKQAPPMGRSYLVCYGSYGEGHVGWWGT